jgi:hypothetical protein
MATARRGRFKLHAYVGANGATAPDVDGTITFETVFIKRPEDCRYAVVGEWDVAQHFERIIVWDLLKTMQKPSGKIMPARVMTCGDVDQAIMATLMMQRGD